VTAVMNFNIITNIYNHVKPTQMPWHAALST